MKNLKLLLIVTIAAFAATASAQPDEPIKVEKKVTVKLGEVLNFQGKDHRSTPCVYYYLEPKEAGFFEVKERMEYDNPERAETMPGGDGGVRHFTLTAIKTGKVDVVECRNTGEGETITTFHYTIVDKNSPTKCTSKKSKKRTAKKKSAKHLNGKARNK